MSGGVLPAYGLDPASLAEAPQCSASGEFCFLCEFEADQEGNCLYSSVVDLIDHLSRSKREIPTIVRAVHRCYEETIRSTVTYTHPDSNQEVHQPEWTPSSIRRHLLYSQNHPQLFDQTVVSILHSLVVRWNAGLIDAETGEPIETKQRALTDTLKALQSWEKHAGLRHSAGSPPAKRKRTS